MYRLPLSGKDKYKSENDTRDTNEGKCMVAKSILGRKDTVFSVRGTKIGDSDLTENQRKIP